MTFKDTKRKTISDLEDEEWKYNPIVPEIYSHLAFIYASRKDSENAKKYITDVEAMFERIYGREMLDNHVSPR